MRCCLALLCACLAAVVLAGPQDCNLEQQELDTRAWINWIGRLIQAQYVRMKLRGFDHVLRLHRNFTEAFKEAGCPEMWSHEYTEQDHNTPGWVYIQEFEPREGGEMLPAVVQFARQIEDFMWLVGRDHVFSECIVTETRNIIFRWLNQHCAKDGHFAIKLDGTMNFPVPNFSEDEEFERTLRAYVAQYIRAQLQAIKCGSIDNYPKATALIARWENSEYCHAAVDSFVSDACFERFETSCPVVFRCLDDFIQQMPSHLEDAFSGSEISNVRKCLERSQSYWKSRPGGRPPQVPKQSKILAQSLKLVRSINELHTHYTEDFKKNVRPYLKALITANFRADMCHCELYRQKE